MTVEFQPLGNPSREETMLYESHMQGPHSISNDKSEQSPLSHVSPHSSITGFLLKPRPRGVIMVLYGTNGPMWDEYVREN